MPLVSQLASMTLLKIGKAYIAVSYDIGNDNGITITRISGRKHPYLKLRPYYIKMIIHHIAKAEGIL